MNRTNKLHCNFTLNCTGLPWTKHSSLSGPLIGCKENELLWRLLQYYKNFTAKIIGHFHTSLFKGTPCPICKTSQKKTLQWRTLYLITVNLHWRIKSLYNLDNRSPFSCLSCQPTTSSGPSSLGSSPRSSRPPWSPGTSSRRSCRGEFWCQRYKTFFLHHWCWGQIS